jgi:drug/metabolite transporter (DMT)-like permease
MIDLWLPITLFAAVIQAVRSAIQKQLKDRLKSTSITWIRFSFGFPLAILFLTGLLVTTGDSVPTLHSTFLINAAAVSIFQLLGTLLVVILFGYRNFAVGTAYVKTETIQTAILGSLLFGETLGIGDYVAIMVGIAGVMMLSAIKHHTKLKAILHGITHKTALIGLAAATCFSLGGLCIRNASLSLDTENPFLAAGLTLALTTGIQTLILGGYMMFREREQFTAIRRHWKLCSVVGITGVLGSLGWFTAFTLQKAAYVKTVGQIDLIISLFIAHWWFKEKTDPHELWGMALITVSIVGILLI